MPGRAATDAQPSSSTSGGQTQTNRRLVVVDAENVRRSRWPNLSREELVSRTRAWAGREGHDLLIVFDGRPPEDAPDLTGAPSADDEIAALARRLERPWWLASSDRELRLRVGDAPERVVGGGSFLRTILGP